ncbi:hypothetical protein K227x_34740 [Rubripirellula lacrimiformis]|uniref:DUF3179 domain-containing protein n=1 Tax=Rubripirellula lacrimiformis TaxID=1930273 RepID=A0A517ND94_9BACT|nr:DUF3179 domain-containing protein [Rubripirellula lacrimiformis]QDT05076.1 hypothetical protein K227x_34740 [Rubripirellula lacrimiformis]
MGVPSGLVRSLLLLFVFAIAVSWSLQRPVKRHCIDQQVIQPIQFRGLGDIGFDLSQATIPLQEIRSGGPPKDGIPSLSNPKIVSAAEATYLRGSDRVIGVALGRESRAYPLAILNYHEIINDRIGEMPIAVTYCPLCDSAVVFDRQTPLGEREFGVSGLLYNSNVLMYDRSNGVVPSTESLWSQVKGEGVSGPGAGMKLTVLPMEVTTWAGWQNRNPNTTVVSSETGHRRNYQASPYAGYFQQPNLMFPAKPISNSLPLKQSVLGVWDDAHALAIPVSAFGGKSTHIERSLGNRKFTVAFDADDQTIRVVKADAGVQWIQTFWFAWYAFRPETKIASR